MKPELKNMLFGVGLGLLAAMPVSADFAAGRAAYDAGDYATALREWRPLAEQGHANAQYNLGLMYRDGEGAPQDNAEAMKWFRLAANHGEASAQLNLGVMYATGKGVPQNLVLAYHWFNLAAAQGEENAKKGKTIVQNKMTAAQIAEAQKLSREFKPKVEVP